MTWTGTAPTWYAEVTHTSRSGIFYENGTPSFTLSQSTPTAYEVRDFFGNIVLSGSISGLTTLTLPTPVGGWQYGWYRLYLTGPNTDAVYGNSYGGAAFVVVPSDTKISSGAAVTDPNPTIDGGAEAKDIITKGEMGIGFSRFQVTDVTNPSGTSDGVANTERWETEGPTGGYMRHYWFGQSGDAIYDSARARYRFMQFPNGTSDNIRFGASGWVRLYPLDRSKDWNQIYAQLDPGTSSGWKITIRYPDSATIVETYDNLANGTAAVTALAASAYVKAFTQAPTSVVNATTATALGSAFYDGVVNIVSSLYPYGYTYYEGPQNEPVLGTRGAEFGWRMKWFQDAVHAGNIGAKAIGPCPVDISSSSWNQFLAEGGGAYCDEFSSHAYNSVTNGDLNLGRYTIEAFLALLASYGYTNPALWITESTNVFTAVYGVHHPRRSRVMLLTTLLYEQYGVPREKNLVWYDRQHGFWSFPSFWETTNKSLAPYAALYRTLTRETFEMTYDSRLTFGNDTAEAIFLGSFYSGASSGCAVLLSHSALDDGATVRLKVTGAGSSVTIVDGWGNESVGVVSGDVVTVPVGELPTYVRLPAGVTPSVLSVLDWPDGQGDSISHQNTSATVGGVSAPVIADGAFMTSYGAGTGIYKSLGTLPEDVVILFSTTEIRGIVAFCQAWQVDSTLLDFDVDLTTDGGTTWTTVATVTKSASSFNHGTSDRDLHCIQETYWDEQYIFPVSFPRQSANGVRLHVRSTSYGGEPDTAAIAAGGQGASTQYITLQEVAILSSPINYTYQWTRDGADITGETSSTYSISSADRGHSIGCTVTATNDGGSTSAASNTLSVGAATQIVGIPILP